jgi:hypothetical protein
MRQEHEKYWISMVAMPGRRVESLNGNPSELGLREAVVSSIYGVSETKSMLE